MKRITSNQSHNTSTREDVPRISDIPQVQTRVDLKRLPPHQRQQALLQMQRVYGNNAVRRRIRALQAEDVAESAEAAPVQPVAQTKPVIQRSIWSNIGKMFGFAKNTEMGVIKAVNSGAQMKARLSDPNAMEGKNAPPNVADTVGDVANIASAPAAVGSAVIEHKTKPNPVGSMFSWLGNKVSQGASWVGGKVRQGASWVSDKASQIGGAIKGGAQTAAAWVAEKAVKVGNWAKDRYDEAKKGWQSFKEGVKKLGQGIKENTQKLVGKAGEMMNTLKNGLVGKAQQLKGLIGDGLKRMGGVWETVKKSAASTSQRILKHLPVRLQSVLNSVGSRASGLLKSIGDSVKGGLKSGFEIMGNLGKGAKDMLISMGKGVGENIKSLWNGAKTLAKGFASKAGQAIQGAKSWLGAKLPQLGGALLGKVKNMLNVGAKAARWTGGMLSKVGGIIAKYGSKVGPWLKAAGPMAGKVLKAIPVVGNVISVGVAGFHAGWALAALISGDKEEAFNAFKKTVSAAVGVIPVVGTIVAGHDLYMLMRGGYNMKDSSGQPVKANNTVDVIAVWLGHARKYVGDTIRSLGSGGRSSQRNTMPPVRMKRADIQRATDPSADPQALDLLINNSDYNGVPIPEQSELDRAEDMQDQDNEPDMDAMREASEGGPVLEELPQAASDADDAVITDESEDNEPADPELPSMMEEMTAPVLEAGEAQENDTQENDENTVAA